MKVLSIIGLLFILVPDQAYATNKSIICGSIKYEGKAVLKMYEPINGYYNQFFSNKIGPNHLYFLSDSFHFTSTHQVPVTFLVYITDSDNNYLTKAVILLLPTDSLHISFDLNIGDKDEITYSGSNSKGHKLFNDLNYDPVSKFRSSMAILSHGNKNSKKFIIEVDSVLSEVTGQFNSLSSNSFITHDYHKYATKTYTQLIYSFIINRLLHKRRDTNDFSREDIKSVIEYLYTNLPVSDINLKSTYNSYLYFSEYYRFQTFKKKTFISFEEEYANNYIIHDKTKMFIGNECNQFLYIKDKRAGEDLWAIFMLQLLNFTPSHTFDTTINQFQTLFPKSKWLTYLKNKQAEKNNVSTVTYNLTGEIRFIDSAKVESLNELLEMLPKNKAVLLDLWASWCGPCIKGFQYNNELDSFLLKHSIAKLYISLDTKYFDQKWREAVDKYALGGYHIRGNERLINNIKQICGIPVSDPIAIPRYLLINEEHEVVLNDASGPTSMRTFIAEIEKYLLNKNK